MQLPSHYHSDLLSDLGNASSEASSQPTECSLVYPSVGFLPFHEIGNGDCYGLYWSNGKEESAPIIVFTSHDAWSLIPLNSDINAFYRCALACSTNDDEDELSDLDLFRQFITKVTGNTPEAHDLRGVSAVDYDQLLKLDPHSPFYLCAAGDIRLQENNVDAAENCYRESLSQLPEYLAAHFGLANVLRRQRRQEEVVVHLREALISPRPFYGGSFWSDTALPGSFRNDWLRKALLWLQQTKRHNESFFGDPFIKRIDELKFEPGVTQSRDLEILRLIVDEYATNGAYSDAAKVWRLVGECAATETTSFRERHMLTPSTFGSRLAELLELSGNSRRALLVRNMVQMQSKPDGLYL